MNEKVVYIENLEAQIRDAQRELTTLKQTRNEILQQAQHEEVERLEQHLEQAQVSVKDILEAAEDAWQELRLSMDATMQNVRETLKKLSNH